MSSQLKRMCVHRAGAGTEAQPVDSTGLEEAPKCSGSSEVAWGAGTPATWPLAPALLCQRPLDSSVHQTNTLLCVGATTGRLENWPPKGCQEDSHKSN